MKNQNDRLYREIDDSSATLKPLQTQPGDTYPLGEVLDHPALFANYPDLALMQVRIGPDYCCAPEQEPVHFDGGADKEALESMKIGALLYQVQLEIQRIEGSPVNTALAKSTQSRLKMTEEERRNNYPAEMMGDRR
jgi:hypothetical protein